MNRRNFLTVLAVGAVAVLAGDSCPTRQDGGLAKEFDFLTRPQIDKVSLAKTDWRNVRKLYVPVRGEDRVNPDRSPELERIVNGVVNDGITNHGWDKQGPYDIKTFRQVFLVPDSQQYIEHILAYCRRCIDFMYNHPSFTGIKMPEYQLTGIKKGDDFTANWDKHVFVGHSSFVVDRVTVANRYKPEQSSEFGKQHYQEDSFGKPFRRKPDNRLAEWYVFLASSLPDVIIKAPFSEIIPLLLYDAYQTHAAQAGQETATLALEAVSEGASHILTREAIQMFRVPYDISRLESYPELLRERKQYKYLKQAIEWIEKHNIREAFDLYMESPEKFMKSIGAT